MWLRRLMLLDQRGRGPDMTKVLTTHVGSLPRTQDVVHFIFARENETPFAPADFDACMTKAVSPRRCSMPRKRRIRCSVSPLWFTGWSASLAEMPAVAQNVKIQAVDRKAL